ncbi:MAG: hypothetical protein CMJ49_00465 [Planctomycetaceae bacterium]|nr:hypothetical protein [Planctomycetaceae bacterium]
MATADYVTATEQDHQEIYQFLAADAKDPPQVVARHHYGSTDPHYVPAQRHLVKVDGQIVSHVYAPRRLTRIGIAEVNIGGIMWVATDPEHRLRGYARQLMRNVFDYLDQTGCVASPLTTPIRDFYRPLGYEDYHNEYRTTINTDDLPADNPTNITIEQYTPDHLPDVMSIYDQCFADWSWTICRSQPYWQWLIKNLEPEDRILVAKDADRIVGYALYVSRDKALLSRDNAVWEAAHRPDCGNVYPALLAGLRRHLTAQNVAQLYLTLPTHHLLAQITRDLGGTTHVSPYYPSSTTSRMMKIINLRAYLDAITPELQRRLQHSPFADHQGALSIQHTGEALSPPASATIQLDHGRVAVQPASDTPDTIAGNERWITTLLIGQQTLTDACDLDRLTVSSDTARQLGSALFPYTCPWRADLDNDTG